MASEEPQREARLAAGVHIPELVASGGVVSVNERQLPPGFRVYSGKDKLKQSFVAVPYERFWYWIKREYLLSKKDPGLAAVTLLMNFLGGGHAKSTAVLTIPAN